jgi:hypothetical protein
VCAWDRGSPKNLTHSLLSAEIEHPVMTEAKCIALGGCYGLVPSPEGAVKGGVFFFFFFLAARLVFER